MSQLIGSQPNQIPTNGMLGGMAFQSPEAVSLTGPAFGTTAPQDSNTTQLATTAFVAGQAGSATPLLPSGVPAAGTSIRFSREDHVHPVKPSIKPSISVDWTLKPTAAALTAAGWTISRASEMTYFGPVPVKVAENLFLDSRNMVTGWTNSAVVHTAVTDESGLVGINLAATAVAGYHALYCSFAAGVLLTSANYRVRFLVKAAAYTKATISNLAATNFAARFDLSAGTALTSEGAGYISHSITPHELGGGLYWCDVVFTSLASGSSAPAIVGYPDSGATLNVYGAHYTGDGTSGIEVYAAQLQQGFDGPWIESTTQPVTLYEKPLLTAASGELAYQHNDSGECLGLLSYPAATNVCLRSQDLGNASWEKTDISATQTKQLWAGSAPFWRVAKTNTALFRGVSQLCFTPAAASTWSFIVALMGDVWSSTTSVDIGLNGVANGGWGADVDTNAAILSGPGVLSKALTGALHRITGLSYTVPTLVRVTRTYPLVESTAQGCFMYPDSLYSTTLGKAILATRVQVESGPRATPYIPTTSATVTRAAQTVTLGGSAFAAANNPAQGTLLARVSLEDVAIPPSGGYSVVEINNGTVNNRTYAYPLGGSLNLTMQTVSSSVSQASYTASGSLSSSPATFAISYAPNAFQAAINATLSAVDTSAVVPVVSQLVVGPYSSGIGLIQRTELYPRAMTASELQAITTPGVL